MKTPTVYRKPKRIYVAGPYSKNPEYYTDIAAEFGAKIMKMGHFAFVPHMATGHRAWTEVLHYEDFMAMDFDIITHWADAVFRFESSPGADREEDLAKSIGRPVLYTWQQLVDYLTSYEFCINCGAREFWARNLCKNCY